MGSSEEKLLGGVKKLSASLGKIVRLLASLARDDFVREK
jgi:hypothetical protein